MGRAAQRIGTDLECFVTDKIVVHFFISSDFWHCWQEVILGSHSACRAEDVFPHGDGK